MLLILSFTVSLKATHHNSTFCNCFSVGEVAHGPGQVVRGHAGRPGEMVGHPSVLVRRRGLHWHVRQRLIRALVFYTHSECGFIDGLVETREGLSSVSR